MADLDQQRLELRPPPFVAADRQRAQRVAVIALPPRDQRGGAAARRVSTKYCRASLIAASTASEPPETK